MLILLCYECVVDYHRQDAPAADLDREPTQRCEQHDAEPDEQPAHDRQLRLPVAHRRLVTNPVNVAEPPSVPNLLLGFGGLSTHFVSALPSLLDGFL